MIIKKLCITTLITISIAIGNLAEANDSQLPSAEILIATHAEKMLKGIDLNHFSLTQSGKLTIEQFNVEGPIVIKYKGPDKYSIYINIFGSEIIRGCNAGVCWAHEFGKEMSLLEGQELTHRLENADFGRFQHMEKHYKSLETIALTEFDGIAAYQVKGIRTNGRTRDLFFSKDSGNLIGTKTEVPQGEEIIEATESLSNFQIHKGSLLATEFFESSPQSESLTTFTNISFDELPDSDFNPPPSIQQALSARKTAR